MQKVSHEQAYQQIRLMLNEKQWRHYLAVEAQQRGSASVVAREAGVSLNTVKLRLTHFCGAPKQGDYNCCCSKAIGLTYSSEECRRTRL